MALVGNNRSLRTATGTTTSALQSINDLLAYKVTEQVRGTKERSKEDIREEINKLLSELENAK